MSDKDKSFFEEEHIEDAKRTHTDFVRETISQKNRERFADPEQRRLQSLRRKGVSNVKLKSSLEQVISKFKNKHGNKYDYSKVEYVNTMTKVEVICPEHGSWWVVPNNHIRGSGCPVCYRIGVGQKKRKEMKEKLSTEEGRNQYNNFLKSDRGHV